MVVCVICHFSNGIVLRVCGISRELVMRAKAARGFDVKGRKQSDNRQFRRVVLSSVQARVLLHSFTFSHRFILPFTSSICSAANIMNTTWAKVCGHFIMRSFPNLLPHFL